MNRSDGPYFPLRVTETRGLVLAELHRRGGPVYGLALEKDMNFSTGHIYRVLAQFAEAGWATSQDEDKPKPQRRAEPRLAATSRSPRPDASP